MPTPSKDSWDLSQLFSSDADPRIAASVKSAEKTAVSFRAHWYDRITTLHTPKNLLAALRDYEGVLRANGTLSRTQLYWHLRSAQNQNDTAVKAQLLQTEERAEKLANQLRFFTLAIQKIPREAQRTLLASAALKPYYHFLERQFAFGAHALRESEENVLALTASTSYTQWVQLTQEALSQETRNGRPLAVLNERCSDPRQSVRDRANAQINSIITTHRATATAEINAILAYKKTDDELRGFTRPDASRHLEDDIETAIVDTMLDTVTSRNSIAHQLYALKARIWGKKQLAYHERNVLLPVKDTTYTYPKALDLVEKTFRSLDPEFGDMVALFAKERRIDVHPKIGKRNGAFCSYVAPTLPVYVLLNYTNRVRDALVIAHELGHGLNGEYMKEQSELNFDSPTSTAEVASTFFEDFVLQQLLATADDTTRLALLLQQLTDEVSTIYRQTALYRFEQELHETFRRDGYLSSDTISGIFSTTMQAYLGPSVQFDTSSADRWVDWPHIRYFFYVYSYSSGLLISKALQAAVHTDPTFITHVKTFLRAGSSRAPRDLFTSLGLDITKPAFWNSGLDEVEQHLKEANNLATRLGY